MVCNNIGVNELGHLTFAGQDTVQLAQQYGTPAYLMDEDRIRHNCRIYMDAMNEEGIYLSYDVMPADDVMDWEAVILGMVDDCKEDGSYKSHIGPEELEGFQVMGIVTLDGGDVVSIWFAWREVEDYTMMVTAEVMGESFDMAALLAGIEVPAA